MGGGKSGGDNTVRFAPYLESAHQALIALSLAEETRLMGLGTTPWDSLSYDNINTAFFAAGLTIASYPVLWDMFGKFVAGLDIEVLYSQIYTAMVNDPVLAANISAESAYLQNDIDMNAIPRMNAGLRDINAVMSSSIIYNKAIIQSQKLLAVNKYAAEVQMKAMELAQNRWMKHLAWNSQVIEQYRAMNQLFWSTKIDVTNAMGELNSKTALWNFTIMDHHRQNVAALNGAAAATIHGESKFEKIMGGIFSGSSGIGSMFQLFGI